MINSALERIDAPVSEHRIVSHDGTSIAYYVAGVGPRSWVIPPGIATPLLSWKHVIERFWQDWRFVVIDPRGTYGSARPADPWRLTIEDHAGDVEAVVDACGLERFVLGGWSMGCQISLEFYRRRPEHVEALVLLNGPYAHALATLAPRVPGSSWVFEGAARGLLGMGERRVTSALRNILFKSGSPALWKATGMLAANAEVEHSRAMLKAFEAIDFGVYLRFLLCAHNHSAEDVLSQVSVPTLITSGGRDRMTPTAVGRALAHAISGSKLVVFPEATHYLLMEFPALLNRTLEEFLGSLELAPTRPDGCSVAS